MRILLDECVPNGLRRFLRAHAVLSAQQVRWASIVDGALLQLAAGRFEAFVTVDAAFPHEHDLAKLPFGVVVLAGPRGPQRTLGMAFERVRDAVERVAPGTWIVVRTDRAVP